MNSLENSFVKLFYSNFPLHQIMKGISIHLKVWSFNFSFKEKKQICKKDLTYSLITFILKMSNMFYNVQEGFLMENRIRELRKTKKMSQEELAGICDVSRQTINAIENNKYDPSLNLAFKIALYLDTTVDDLFQFQLEES